MLNEILMAMLLGSGPDALFQGGHLSDTGLEAAVVSYARTGDCDRARGHWHTLRSRGSGAAALLDEVLACMSDRARSASQAGTHDRDVARARADAVWADAVAATTDQRRLASQIGQSAERKANSGCSVERELCFSKIKMGRDNREAGRKGQPLDTNCEAFVAEYERLHVRRERF